MSMMLVLQLLHLLRGNLAENDLITNLQQLTAHQLATDVDDVSGRRLLHDGLLLLLLLL